MVEVPASVVEEAVDWAVRIDFGEPDPDTQQAFDAWLRAAPAHAEAWRRLHALAVQGSGLPGSVATDVLTSVARDRRARSRRQALKLLVTAGVVAGTGWAVRGQSPVQRLLADQYTIVGERRRVGLADGTVIHLNTDTAVDLDFVDGLQRVFLRRGEVNIDTTGGNARPILLETDCGQLRPLDACFNARRDTTGVRVDVRQGRVRLLPDNGLAYGEVPAGAAAYLTIGGMRDAPARGIDAAGWVDGVVSARDARLADVLEEFARYRHGVLRCQPEIAGRRVSGIYHLDDIGAALRFLVRSEHLRLLYRTSYWISVVQG